MKTIDIGPNGLDKHIARFRELKPKQALYADSGIPTEAYEMLTAKTIYTAMAPAGAGGSHRFAAAEGPEGFSISICECPPGDGPMLHAHLKTHEIFMCLKGRFEVRWGDDGQYSTILEPLDIVDVPLGVTRAFKNVSDETALLHVTLLGGDQNDVGYTKAVGEEVAAKFGADVRDAIEANTSMKFVVGAD